MERGGRNGRERWRSDEETDKEDLRKGEEETGSRGRVEQLSNKLCGIIKSQSNPRSSF